MPKPSVLKNLYCIQITQGIIISICIIVVNSFSLYPQKVVPWILGNSSMSLPLLLRWVWNNFHFSFYQCVNSKFRHFSIEHFIYSAQAQNTYYMAKKSLFLWSTFFISLHSNYVWLCEYYPWNLNFVFVTSLSVLKNR